MWRETVEVVRIAAQAMDADERRFRRIAEIEKVEFEPVGIEVAALR
jgi:hypothetical protein